MASTSETGHDIDITNAGIVLTILDEHKTEYLPPEPALEVAVLSPQVEAARLAQDAVNEALKAYRSAVQNQENLFEGLAQLFTVVKETVELLRIPENRKDEVRSINKKMQGQRVGKKPTEKEGKEAPKTISVSQRSYTSQIGHLKSLIGTLKEIPEYAPKQVERQIASLETLKEKLEAAAAAVVPAETTLANARTKRDKLFYTEISGLIDTMAAVKKFWNGIKPRGKHPAYVKINRLKFTRKPKDK